VTESEREIVRRVIQRVREIGAKASPAVYAALRFVTAELLPLVGKRE
jgi:hypothetical protein